jgi:glycosyltransferase involved in cell wall biosynthesis
MKLLFLFNAKGNAQPGSTPDDWEPNNPCGQQYMDSFYREGYFILLEKFAESGLFDEITIVYESNVDPGYASWIRPEFGFVRQIVMPEIRFAEKYIDEDTIIWARGGFRHWHDWLLKYKGKNWLILYAANTGRQRWTFWDVVLDDINMLFTIDSHNRIYYPFIKPIDDSFYFPVRTDYFWDICIGASYIHDKKGQWRAIELFDTYLRMYGGNLRGVMPGAMRRGVKTNAMIETLQKGKYLIDTPGMLDKTKLMMVYNRSKVFVHMGSHGQNDRGPLEAAACGCRVILGSPRYHSARLITHNIANFVMEVDNFEEWARVIRLYLCREEYPIKKVLRANEFKKVMGLDEARLRMTRLFLELQKQKPTIEGKKSAMLALA